MNAHEVQPIESFLQHQQQTALMACITSGTANAVHDNQQIQVSQALQTWRDHLQASKADVPARCKLTCML